MNTHSDLAKELFKKGYNCSQAVFAAFCDQTGLDFDTSLKIASSFGGGMGRLREVCGAVSGMLMVVALNMVIRILGIKRRKRSIMDLSRVW